MTQKCPSHGSGFPFDFSCAGLPVIMFSGTDHLAAGHAILKISNAITSIGQSFLQSPANHHIISYHVGYVGVKEMSFSSTVATVIHPTQLQILCPFFGCRIRCTV